MDSGTKLGLLMLGTGTVAVLGVWLFRKIFGVIHSDPSSNGDSKTVNLDFADGGRHDGNP